MQLTHFKPTAVGSAGWPLTPGTTKRLPSNGDEAADTLQGSIIKVVDAAEEFWPEHERMLVEDLRICCNVATGDQMPAQRLVAAHLKGIKIRLLAQFWAITGPGSSLRKGPCTAVYGLSSHSSGAPLRNNEPFCNDYIARWHPLHKLHTWTFQTSRFIADSFKYSGQS